MVEKFKDNERGVEAIAPMYTHLDKDGQPCGILVNRGWIPWDLKDFRQDHIANNSVVRGVLYQGDEKTKYSKVNNPTKAFYRGVYPEELAVMCRLPNESEASSLMLRAVDFDEANPTAMPDVPNKTTLTSFGIPAARHEAYEGMWDTLTYAGVLANTAVWLYL